MQTLKTFIKANRIRMTAEWAGENPKMSDMPAGSSHWKCTFRRDNLRMTIPFSQGPAISGEPTAEDVLECLLSDSASVENAGSFEDWCSEFGYDQDSRKAESVFRACKDQAAKLRKFLGNLHDTALWHLEQS